MVFRSWLGLQLGLGLGLGTGDEYFIPFFFFPYLKVTNVFVLPSLICLYI